MSRIKEETCEICGKSAAGTHFGISACGGCRAFRKRAVRDGRRYFCSNGDNCSVLVIRRGRCRACRLSKYELLLRAKTSGIESDGKWKPARSQRFTPSGLDVERYTPPDINGSPLNGVNFLSENARQVACIANVVDAVVHLVWGDDISRWTSSRDREPFPNQNLLNTLPLPRDEQLSRRLIPDRCSVLTQTNTDSELEQVVMACNSYRSNHTARGRKFVSMLPDVSELDQSSMRGCLAPGWKRLLMWTVRLTQTFTFLHYNQNFQQIHHAVFLNKLQAHITSDAAYNECEFGSIIERPVFVFMRVLCAEFREIGLTQLERYLLLIVVLFEPDCDNGVQNHGIQRIHKQYAQILLDILRWRCSDAAQLHLICRKLGLFFSRFKTVDRMCRQYADDLFRPPWFTDDDKEVLLRDGV